MESKVKFILPKDLIVIENEIEFVLRKGFIHKNEIIIDKIASSNDFIQYMKEFLENKFIILSEKEEVYEDFMQLVKFGLIQIESNQEKVLIVCNSNYMNMVKKFFTSDLNIINVDKLLSYDDLNILIEDKSPLQLKSILNSKEDMLRDYDYIYYIENLVNISYLRGFNKLMRLLKKENAIGIIDNDHIFLTGIRHGYTGCYQCLENHVISKFDGNLDNYLENFKINGDYFIENTELCLLLSIIMKDIENVGIYGATTLLGNVLHFYLPNFEYSFNVNLRSTACSECAGFNNVLFEEQNVRSINILKEIYDHD